MTLPQQYRWLTTIGAVLGAVGSDGRSDSAIRGPAKRIDPVVERHGLDPVSLSGFDNRHLFAAEAVASVARLVALLLFTFRPAAICLRIRTVIVDPVKRVALRARAHVAKEIGEALQPFGTDVNAAPAVVRILLPVSRVATPLHLGPRGHGRCVGKTVHSIQPTARASYFAIEAPAAFRATGAKIGTGHHSLSPALTATKRLVSRATDNRPATVLFANRRGGRVHSLTLSLGQRLAKEKVL